MVAWAGGAADSPAVLSGALSRALCLINKAQLSGRAGGKRRSRPRILCLQGSRDAPEQYIGVMNAIFAAQACGIEWPCESRNVQETVSLEGSAWDGGRDAWYQQLLDWDVERVMHQTHLRHLHRSAWVLASQAALYCS
jgi:hypothetical protein